MLTNEQVVNAYELMLGRAPENESISAKAASSHRNAIHLIKAIMNSPEFLALWNAEMSVWPMGRFVDIAPFLAFKRTASEGEPGFVTNFLGVKTDITNVYSAKHLSGRVEPIPIPDGDWHGEILEWRATLQSVLEAQDRLIVYELGAGWAPWLVIAATAAKQRGIEEVHLTGLEASSGHYGMMSRHFANNHLDPQKHRLLHAAASDVDGTAEMPVLADPSADWGAAVSAAGSAHSDGVFTDYRGHKFEETETVPMMSLAGLLEMHDRVDLIHIDIQGAESKVVKGTIDALTKKVHRLVIGTHSRAIETELAETLAPAGWDLEAETAATLDIRHNRVVYMKDGCQVWRNPKV